jgi:hypothetical protein
MTGEKRGEEERRGEEGRKTHYPPGPILKNISKFRLALPLQNQIKTKSNRLKKVDNAPQMKRINKHLPPHPRTLLINSIIMSLNTRLASRDTSDVPPEHDGYC